MGSRGGFQLRGWAAMLLSLPALAQRTLGVARAAEGRTLTGADDWGTALVATGAGAK